MTVVVLIFGEITPKSLAKDSPEAFAMFSAPLINLLSYLLLPLNLLFSLWKKLLGKIFRVKKDDRLSHEDGISAIMNTHYPTNAMSVADEAFMMNHKGTFFYGSTEKVLTEKNISVSFDVNVVVNEFSHHQKKIKSIVPVSLTDKAM